MKQEIADILKDIPMSDFDGVDDPVDVDMICPHTLGEALEERVRYYIEVSPEIAKRLATAFVADVDWHGAAVAKIADWSKEETA
jgi:hypothetical protein